MKKRERRNSKICSLWLENKEERFTKSNNNIWRSKSLDPLALRETITLS
jgi:type IV secretory pathway VirB3-like protein